MSKNLYDGLEMPDALRLLAQRYLRKPESVQLCNDAATYIEHLQLSLDREENLVDRLINQRAGEVK